MSNIIIPGDSLSSHLNEESTITIGPGIYKNPRTQDIIPLQAGFLKDETTSKKNKEQLIYIESNSKRYIPQVNDLVLGIVTGSFSEFFRVQLQEYSQPVQLSMMAFPNATKKNRPNLKVGQAVYARVSEAVPEVVTEIECIDPETGKEGGFGPLDERGYIFDVNLNFARELLFNKSFVVLEKLAAKVPFEIAIGINGKIWLKCGADEPEEQNEDGDIEMKDSATVTLKQIKITLAAAKYIIACQHIPQERVDAELKKALKGAL
ncbi:hypothetical protein METBIDRAFT_79672 [Metschnikowia bicuspidata var. bicuspidata NRRL YB-4993]|uniref:Ribosomal RNA-processing protein 40 n=1 Tax=Metschnikowia bicuspidata var. bicuspidata NRRL YB-4993 TaxID=869754 RepID=A0A1A0H6V2_9ASCO|nr:hypothetical protein METBIDRAFT_79672 [Metschnikowia bicuspidata var. bicuspidata NRRL YB-4993]OBA19680.1 hypothetical protein METBIDRAFT_79672 [Metschnikowia bicuspidata var. bicuspidata NRRL YB-4993]